MPDGSELDGSDGVFTAADEDTDVETITFAEWRRARPFGGALLLVVGRLLVGSVTEGAVERDAPVVDAVLLDGTHRCERHTPTVRREPITLVGRGPDLADQSTPARWLTPRRSARVPRG
jgi:hypothetical protein